MPNESPGWALAPLTHHLDHLAPVCASVGAVLVVPDERTAERARDYYPGIDIAVDQPWRRPRAFEGRTVYYSHLYTRDQLREMAAGDPPARVVFCPHGFSEKRHRWSAMATQQDVFLVLGQFGLDQLRDWGALTDDARYVVTGNMRYRYYRQHQEAQDRVAARLTHKRDARRKTIFYAPTWSDQVGTTSAFGMLEHIIAALPAGYDLLIKPHPLLEKEADHLDRLTASAGSHPRVTVLRNNPLTFPLLALADVYVGDMSALAYDFLVFDRPMYFLNQARGGPADSTASQLFQCGVVLESEDHGRLFETIDRTWDADAQHGPRRARLWSYVHDESRLPAQVAREILAATQGPAPDWMTAPAKVPR